MPLVAPAYNGLLTNSQVGDESVSWIGSTLPVLGVATCRDEPFTWLEPPIL